MTTIHHIHTLVVACGNSLRGDDVVGPAAADIIQAWRMPGVKVLTVHQLVPELIHEMKNVQRVLFIDAATNIDGRAFQACTVEAKRSRRFFGHHETAANLLALLHELEDQMPEARLVSISALSFEHGAEISEEARNHLHAALAWIRVFLAEPACATPADASL